MLNRILSSLLALVLFYGVAEAQAPRNLKREVIDARIANSAPAAPVAIAAGVFTVTQASHILAAESGTADTVTSFVITAMQAGDTVKIAADTGDTITIDAAISDTGVAFDIADDEFAYVHIKAGGAYIVSRGGGGGSEAAETFNTKTLAAAATWPATLTVVKTLGYAAAGDNGAAEYRVTSCPGALKVWHIQSANGLCATLADKEVALEAFGFSTANSAAQNDTAFDALEEALLPASGLGLKKVYAGSVGGTYNWGTIADGLVALNLVNVNGVELDFRNSLWPASFSTTRRIGFIQLTTGSSFNYIHSVRGSQPNYTSTAVTGVDWFVETTGAHFNRLEGDFLGGLQGYSATGNYNVVEARVYGSTVKIKTKNVYYGMANQTSGDFSRYDVTCEGSVRCVIAYNALGNEYNFTNLSATTIYPSRANQYLLKAYGTAVPGVVNEFTGHKVRIRDYALNDSVAPPTPVLVQHDQNEIACGSVGTKISIDFDLDFDLGTDAERYQALIGNEALRYATPGTCGSGKQIGEPASGVNADRITVTGRVTGDLAGSTDAAALGLSASGIGPATLSDWSFVDFSAPSLTRPINSGQYNNLSLLNVNAPSASITFAATRSGRFGAKNSKTATFGNLDAHYQPTSGGVNVNLNGVTSSGINFAVNSALKADNVVDATGYYIRGNNGLYLGATTFAGSAGNYMQLQNTYLAPLTTNTMDLGSTATNWKDLILSGEIIQNGNADTAITPIWGNDGTANTLGNGTLTGTVRKIGNRVFFDISLTFGSTTIVGSSTMFFQLPAPYNSNFTTNCAGSVYALDNGTNVRAGVSRMFSGFNKIYMATDAAANTFTATIPIVWASGDFILASGNCEL